MQQSDFEGIERSGALARTRCLSYFDNPWLLSEPVSLRAALLAPLAEA